MKHELCLFQDGAKYSVIIAVRRMLSFLCCDCCTLYIASHKFGTWVLISFFTGYKTPEQTDRPRWHASDAVLTRSVQIMFVPLTKQVSLYKWSSVRAMSIIRMSVKYTVPAGRERGTNVSLVQLICEGKVLRTAVVYVCVYVWLT